jgi:hypothetical protein
VLEEFAGGAHLYLALDPLNRPGSETYYGILNGTAARQQSVGDGTTAERFTIGVPFEEDLG